MKDKKYDVFGIGSALMDFLVMVDDSHLSELNLSKGQMHLTDDSQSEKILSKIKD